MELKKLINILTDILNANGNINVVGIVNAGTYEHIEVKYKEHYSNVYIELYEHKQ